MLKKLWQKWMAFSTAFGNFMSRLILSVLYFSIVLPWGIGVRLFSDRLDIKKTPRDGAWKSLPRTEDSLKEFRQQF